MLLTTTGRHIFTKRPLSFSSIRSIFFFFLNLEVKHIKRKQNTFKATPTINNTKHYPVNLNGIIWNVVSTCIDYWQPEVKGPGLCSRVPGSLVGWDRGERAGWVGGLSGGLVRFYKSQCKSRDKYYLLFEERHSRYLLYRGKSPVCLEHKFRLDQRKTWWLRCSIQEGTRLNELNEEGHPPEWADIEQDTTHGIHQELWTH